MKVSNKKRGIKVQELSKDLVEFTGILTVEGYINNYSKRKEYLIETL